VAEGAGEAAADPVDPDAVGVGATLPTGVVGIGRPQPAKVATRVVVAAAATSTRLTGKGPVLPTTIGSDQQS
jgi:hypothetical protein